MLSNNLGSFFALWLALMDDQCESLLLRELFSCLPGNLNPFVPNPPFLCPLKTSENRKDFSDSLVCIMGALGMNGLRYSLLCTSFSVLVVASVFWAVSLHNLNIKNVKQIQYSFNNNVILSTYADHKVTKSFPLRRRIQSPV